MESGSVECIFMVSKSITMSYTNAQLEQIVADLKVRFPEGSTAIHVSKARGERVIKIKNHNRFNIVNDPMFPGSVGVCYGRSFFWHNGAYCVK